MADVGEIVLTPGRRYPASSAERPFDSWDALKLLALLLMFIDHSGAFIFTDDKWLRAIGRGAMPIFLYLGGFAASYRFKWNLLALAVLMSVSDFLLAHRFNSQNILFLILGSRLIFNWFERRGKRIERPWEWYIGSLALFASVFVVQYGSLGFLFALSGYLKRHADYYPPALPRRFLIASFAAYFCYTQFNRYSGFEILLIVLIFYDVYRLLDGFSVRNIAPQRTPAALISIGKWISYYSGYIYAFHLIALEWITGIPF